MSLYYITFGSNIQLTELQLEFVHAANQKSNYIIEKLNLLSKSFEVISLAETGSKQLKYYKGRSVSCGKYGKYTVWNTFGKPNFLFRRIHKYYRLFQLYNFLSKLSSKDTVIVYHSLLIAEMLYKLHRKNKFKLILELEEFYQDVGHVGKRKSLYENKITEDADGYILVARELLNRIPKGRPYIVFNGTYHAETKIEQIHSDNKIHCVYAGNCNAIKGGADMAISATKFLPANYHVHILGVGKKNDIERIKQQVYYMQKKTMCTITFDGLKTGDEFIHFLQKCHIGLSTQNPNEKYVETSFPSKILVYLANGLRVLSGNISAVKNSDVGDLLYYYANQTPQEIAESILSIDLNSPYDSRTRLKELDKQFQKDLKILLDKVSSAKNV